MIYYTYTEAGIIGGGIDKMNNWAAIRAEYIAGGGSYSTLSAKYGVSVSSVKKHAQKDGWTAARAAAAAEVQRRAADKAAELTASNAVKLERARGIIIDRALEAAEKISSSPKVETISDLKALVDVIERLAAVTVGQDKAIERLDALISAIDRAARE